KLVTGVQTCALPISAVLAKLDAKAKYYRLDASRGWMPDLDHLKSLVTPATRALVVIDPNNPTGAVYPTETRRALLDFADEHNLQIGRASCRESAEIR